MKRYPFRTAAFVLAFGLLAACQPVAETSTSPAPPTGVHTAPQRGPVNLAPSRTGASIEPQAPPGSALPATKVALLLPLTGRNADLGRAMQDAATVALFDKYAALAPTQAEVRVELLPKDTGDTPEEARTAMQAALAEGAQLIIGPLFADATQAAAPFAREKKISVISLSNNPSVAGPGVYAFGFSPQEQTARVVSYALKNGKSRVAALVPDSPLGEAVLAAAKAAASKHGAVLAAEAKYAPQGVGLDAALSQLMPPGTPPQFDALLLPEGGPALNTMLRALSARGVSQPDIQLLGTGIWDDANLIRRVSLEGGWLASSPPQSTSLFENRFIATYNYTPQRIASLAYDAVALAVTLATADRDFSTATLTNPAGYMGPANGVFRLKPNGTVERTLAVLRIQGSTFVVIDPAPAGFTSQAAPQ